MMMCVTPMKADFVENLGMLQDLNSEPRVIRYKQQTSGSNRCAIIMT